MHLARISMFTLGSSAIAGALLPASASAACPGVFFGTLCNGGAGPAVCNNATLGGVTTITCDLDASGGGLGASANFVTPVAGQLRAFGYESDGDAFCCEFSVWSNAMCSANAFEVYGTDDNDVIRLTDSVASQTMFCVNGRGVDALAGDDLIIGSVTLDQWDFLLGGDGIDEIRGMEGDDWIEGGDDGDYLYGSSGTDVIYGGLGDDWIKGGLDQDYLYGDENDDAVCGEGGDDILEGNDGDDSLYGGGGSDNHDGGSHVGGDECEDVGDPNCETSLASCPF